MKSFLNMGAEWSQECLKFAAQIGVDGVVAMPNPPDPNPGFYDIETLVELRTCVESFDLEFYGIRLLPWKWTYKWQLGLPGREEQLENMCETVRNIGRAGIPILGYHFMPAGVWRTSETTPIRGGAQTTSFNIELAKNAPLLAGREVPDEQMWENYDWYLDRILPICEEAGVRFALHPDDPPVESIGGIARLFRCFENFDRALTRHDSPMHGLNFCHGCWSEMRGGEGVVEAIRHFGPRGKIFYVHFRDVQGSADNFTECWVGEGNSNMPNVVRTLKEVGFNGFMIPDHVPHIAGDTPWCHRGRAYTVGFMKAMLAAIEV